MVEKRAAELRVVTETGEGKTAEAARVMEMVTGKAKAMGTATVTAAEITAVVERGADGEVRIVEAAEAAKEVEGRGAVAAEAVGLPRGEGVREAAPVQELRGEPAAQMLNPVVVEQQEATLEVTTIGKPGARNPRPRQVRELLGTRQG